MGDGGERRYSIVATVYITTVRTLSEKDTKILGKRPVAAVKRPNLFFIFFYTLLTTAQSFSF